MQELLLISFTIADILIGINKKEEDVNMKKEQN